MPSKAAFANFTVVDRKFVNSPNFLSNLLQILLEGPDDISCFKFNPTNPNIIAGGCINGQLVLWDISEYESKLSSSRGSHVNPSAKKKVRWLIYMVLFL